MGACIDKLRANAKTLGLTYVGTRGNLKAPICVAGEAPGAEEDQRGIPFCGPSGREQDRMLFEAGINPNTDCWFTNPYKCRPPENDLARIEELGIPKGVYEGAFLEELREAQPTILVAAGATALHILVPDLAKRAGTTNISRWRGSLLTSPLFNWPHYIIPVQHPAFIISHSWTDRPVSVLCYAKAKDELTFVRQHGILQPLPIRDIKYDITWGDACDYLEECLASPADAYFSIDIESYKRRFVYLIAIAKSPTDAVSIGLWDYMEASTNGTGGSNGQPRESGQQGISGLSEGVPDNGSGPRPERLLQQARSIKLFRLLDKLLHTRKQIGQNYSVYDCHWLESLGFGFPLSGFLQDTMVRQHVLYPELEKSLQFMTMQYTREPFYKDEGKHVNIKKPEDVRRWKKYNALDAAVTYEVFLAQEEEFKYL